MEQVATEQKQEQKPKSRVWAGVLSFLLPGLGHFYAGTAFRLAFGISLFYYASQEIIPWLFRSIDSWSVETFVAMGFCWLLNLLIIVSAVVYLSRRACVGVARRPRHYLGFLVCMFLLAMGVDYLTSSDKVRSFHTWHQSSTSMEPTLLQGDRVWCDMAAYRFGNEPFYGDLAVFESPSDNGDSYIKRIVGLPGDRIEIIEGLLLINGSRITRGNRVDESLLERHYQIKVESQQEGEHPMLNWPSDEDQHVVAEDAVFVLGDNRLQSIDSRIWGDVPLSKLRGRCEGVVWSYGPEEGLRRERVMMDLQ